VNSAESGTSQLTLARRILSSNRTASISSRLSCGVR